MFIVYDNNGFKKEFNWAINKYEYTVCHNSLYYKLDEDKLLNLIYKNRISNAYFDGSNISHKEISILLVDVNVDNFIDFKRFDYSLSLYDIENIDETYYNFYDDIDVGFNDKRNFNKLRYAADQELLDAYKLVYYGNDIIGILEVKKFDNVYFIVTVHSLLKGFNELDIIDFVLKKYPKAVYMDGRSSVYSKSKFYEWKLLNFKSSLSSLTDEWNRYDYANCSSGSNYYTYYDENIVFNYIESKYKNKIDLKKLKVYDYKEGSDFSLGHELSKRFMNLEFISWVCSGNGNYNFIGFKYFKLDDIASYSLNHSIFVVTYEDIILCACKYKNHSSYTGLSYFEVNQFYKTIELENILIQLFSKYVYDDKPLYLPMDDREEKETKLSERMKKYITSTLVKTNDEIRAERGF